MKRFFGYGVQAITAENGVVSVRPTRSGFGATGITVLEPGTIEGTIAKRLGFMWGPMPTYADRVGGVIPTVPIAPPLVLPGLPGSGGATVTLSAPINDRSKLFLSKEFVATQEPVLTRSRNIAITEKGTATDQTGGRDVPGGPGEIMPYECAPGGPIVNAASLEEAMVKCATAAKTASRDLGGDTMKYLLIGGAALVAILLLKK